MTAGKPALVDLRIDGNVAFVTFARADDGNVIDLPFGRELLAIALAIEADVGVKAVVMTGEGRNFCFGGDLKGMVASGSATQAYLAELTTTLHAAMTVMARMNAPVIAAVNGAAAGAGLGLVLVADLAIAARSAKFVAAYTGVALTPDAGCTFFLPRLVGGKRAMELFLTNRVLSADEALAWGIVNDVVEDAALSTAARALATKIAAGPLGAFGLLKRLMAESQPGLEAQLGRESRSIALQGASGEGSEGIAAFLEKRLPASGKHDSSSIP